MRHEINRLVALFIVVSLGLFGCGKPDPTPPGPTPIPGVSSVKIGTPALPETTYSWSPSDTLDSPLSPEPMASPKKTTLYTVTATTKCGSATSSVAVRVFRKDASGQLEEVL
jgi:hypothetical protein